MEMWTIVVMVALTAATWSPVDRTPSCQHPIGNYSGGGASVGSARTSDDTESDVSIEMDLGAVHHVTAVRVGGSTETNSWISAFMVGYKNTAGNNVKYLDKIFHGNTDASDVTTNVLDDVISARYVVITSLRYHGDVRLGVDILLLGCQENHCSRHKIDKAKIERAAIQSEGHTPDIFHGVTVTLPAQKIIGAVSLWAENEETIVAMCKDEFILEIRQNCDPNRRYSMTFAHLRGQQTGPRGAIIYLHAPVRAECLRIFPVGGGSEWGQWTVGILACTTTTPLNTAQCHMEREKRTEKSLHKHVDDSGHKTNLGDRWKSKVTSRKRSRRATSPERHTTSLIPSPERRIVGGVTSEPGQLSWMVSINEPPGELDDGVRQHFCGGSLIHKRYILTAGHCARHKDIDIQWADSPADYPTYILNWDTNFTQWFVRFGNQNVTSDAEEIRVEKVFVHPDYVNKEPINHRPMNDVALIKLSQEVQLTEDINTICLPNDEIIGVGARCVVAGWGAEKPFSDTRPYDMKYAEVTLINNEECARMYNLTEIDEGELCAYAPRRDTCQGDSGGALACISEGRWVQVGVISWGKGCAEKDVAGVYARVGRYQEWIRAVINTDS